MISFDIKSLFSNVPLDKTILENFNLRKIYRERMIKKNVPKKK